MLEKMMAMAQVIKNLSVENEQLKETRKRNRYLMSYKNTKNIFLYTKSASTLSSYPEPPNQ